jgi:glutamyl-tRNA synthetase
LDSEQVKKNLADGTPYVIRLKVPQGRMLSYNDLFLGKVEFPTDDVEDQILLKSDGFPTYHLAVVVDDHLMEITHIFRGVEWLASTPKHILIYEFLGWKMAATGHMPLLKDVGETKKMSKRLGDVAAAEFLKNGYLPEALLNFIMLLGWNPGTEKEIFTLNEFVKEFSLERVQKTDLVSFDWDKLLWFNGYYIRKLGNDELYGRLTEWANKWEVNLELGDCDRGYAVKVVGLVKDRLKTFAEFNGLSRYFFTDPEVRTAQFSKYSGDNWSKILNGFLKVLVNVDVLDWTKDTLDKTSHEFIEREKYTPREAFMTLRAAVTGQEATPPLFEVLELLGKEVVLRRLDSVMTGNSS